MDLNIHADMRVLYKENNEPWRVGVISPGSATIDDKGIKIPVFPIKTWKEMMEARNYEYAEVQIVRDYPYLTNIRFDSTELQDWMKDSLMTKEEYIKIIQSEDFHRSTEVAWVSDGEYYYYPVSKFNDTWIMKQPFDYILRMT